MTARVTQNDVGSLFVDRNGDAWRMLAYVDRPTATFERLEPPETARQEGFTPCRMDGVVVSSPIFDELGFRRLVPEES